MSALSWTLHTTAIPRLLASIHLVSVFICYGPPTPFNWTWAMRHHLYDNFKNKLYHLWWLLVYRKLHVLLQRGLSDTRREDAVWWRTYGWLGDCMHRYRYPLPMSLCMHAFKYVDGSVMFLQSHTYMYKSIFVQNCMLISPCRLLCFLSSGMAHSGFEV